MPAHKIQPIEGVAIHASNWPPRTRVQAVAAQLRQQGYALVNYRLQLMAVRIH